MGHEHITTNGGEFQGRISTDLEPMYLLSEADYQAFVNQLTNVVIDTIGRLRAAGHAGEACLLAEETHDVLLGYDEDVADYVLRLSGAADEEAVSSGAAGEVATW